MEKGKLIVLEGACDGMGKTTQTMLLKQRLEKEGRIVDTHHFPSYGTCQGSAVEGYLRGDYGMIRDLSPYLINALYAIDRGVTWNTVLKEWYENGHMILLDRYTTSSLIYQSAVIENQQEKEAFLDYIVDFEYHKIGIQEPDKVLFLYTDFEVAQELLARRVGNAGVQNDIYERDHAFMKKIYHNAMFLADYFSWDKIKCSEGGRMLPIEEIHEKVYQKTMSK